MKSLIAANLSCLQQGREFLAGITDSEYAEPCAHLFNSSIGGHFRHNLDHYEAFLDGLESGRIDYDRRGRSHEVETCRGQAIALMESQEKRLAEIECCSPEHPLRICMDDGGASAFSATSLQRELQFLLSHTIHHYALVVAIAASRGHTAFPPNFGIAPSTLHHQASVSC